MKKYRNIIYIFMIIFLISCTEKNKIKQSNQKVLQLEQIFSLNLYNHTKLAAITNAFLDNLGCVHIVDIKSSTYLKLNPRGKIVREVVRKGQGPGEWINITSVQVFGNDIVLSDLMTRRLIFFNQDLEYKKYVQLNVYPMKFYLIKNRALIMTDSLINNCYSFKIFLQDFQKDPLQPRELFSGNCLSLNKMCQYFDCDNPGTINFAVDDGLNILYCIKHVATDFTIYSVNLMNNERMEFKKEWEPVALNESEKRESLEKILSAMKGISNYPKEKFRLKNKISTSNIAVDQFHNIWVTSAENNSSSIPIFIFNHRGRLVSSKPVSGFSNPNISINKDKIILYETEPQEKLILACYYYKFI